MPLVKFIVIWKKEQQQWSEMLLMYISLFHPHVYIWPNLLSIKQHIVTYWMKKQIWEYNCIQLGQILSHSVIHWHTYYMACFLAWQRLAASLCTVGEKSTLSAGSWTRGNKSWEHTDAIFKILDWNAKLKH